MIIAASNASKTTGYQGQLPKRDNLSTTNLEIISVIPRSKLWHLLYNKFIPEGY